MQFVFLVTKPAHRDVRRVESTVAQDEDAGVNEGGDEEAGAR